MNLSIIKEKVKNLKRIVPVAILGATCIAAVSAITFLSKTYYITSDEETVRVTALMGNNTESILNLAGISLEENDQVIREDNEDNILIKVNRAMVVSVSVDNDVKETIMHNGTVADALADLNISISDIDVVEPSLDTVLEDDIKINITRWYNINFSDNGETKTVAVPEGDVQSTLEYLQCPGLDEDDIINCDFTDMIDEDFSIVIDRVSYEEFSEVETIPYKKTTQNTSDLYQGETKLLVSGKDGERQLIKKKTIVNGEVVETEILSSEVTVDSIDEVTLVGTKQKTVTIPLSSKYSYTVTDGPGTFRDHNGNWVSYSKSMSGSCTAYYEPAGSLCSTGRTVGYGNVAVNPNIIPYGTRMYVVSADGSIVYGYATAADTGGALMAGLGLLDLYFPSESACVNFGRRNMIVYILD